MQIFRVIRFFKLQTRKRLKRTLFITTKHNIHIFGVILFFFKLQRYKWFKRTLFISIWTNHNMRSFGIIPSSFFFKLQNDT